MTRRGSFDSADFVAGMRVTAPVLVSMVPFAVITGAVSVREGLSPLVACGLSFFVFAGTSQLAAIQLIQAAAPPVVILFTVLVINLRFTIYSASLAPHFKRLGGWRKTAVAYLLTDQAYILSLLAFDKGARSRKKFSFYLGTALPLWVMWQLGTLLGALAGSQLPTSWGLDFAAPLTFLALLVPAIRDRPAVAAATAAGAVAVLAHALPWNLGLLLGACAGVVAGSATAARRANQ